jgi:endonuclease/exonuclease/phosphatase family metal-dependent hydrolase
MKVKFLSLNLWHGTLIDGCVEFLKNQDADIVILQEVHDGNEENLPNQYRSLGIIKEKLDYPYIDFVPALLFHDPAGNSLEGNAILSKFKIADQSHLFFREKFDENYHDEPEQFSICPRVLEHAKLETPAGEVNVYNFQGVWDLDGDNYTDRRREMSEKIIAEIKDKPNVLLGGDTNAKPTNQAIKNIEQYLTSVFGTALKSTFNMRHKDNPGYATAAVDMLFVSPNIKILNKECPDVDISDHFPVVASLEIN